MWGILIRGLLTALKSLRGGAISVARFGANYVCGPDRQSPFATTGAARDSQRHGKGRFARSP